MATIKDIAEKAGVSIEMCIRDREQEEAYKGKRQDFALSFTMRAVDAAEDVAQSKIKYLD